MAARLSKLLKSIGATHGVVMCTGGLALDKGLIAALDSSPALAQQFYGAVWDLRAYRFQLEYAERVRTRFYLVISY